MEVCRGGDVCSEGGKMKLVIAEKPSVAASIAKVIGAKNAA